MLPPPASEPLMHQWPDKLAANITHAPSLNLKQLTRQRFSSQQRGEKTFSASCDSWTFVLNWVEMVNGKVLFCVVLVAAWCDVQPASIPFLPSRVGSPNGVLEAMHPAELLRGRVREGVPPPLCAGRCVAPPTGPVCAFDAAGTARTFATLCELEAVSCRESTYYAITSLGEC